MSGKDHIADDRFEVLISQLQQGDSAAATEIVTLFEPEIRRFIRFRLTDPQIRRFIDSLDISQSVFARFFVEMERGRFDFSSPEKLQNLLLSMARNKIYDNVRAAKADKRDFRRLQHTDAIQEAAAPELDQLEKLQTSEMIEMIRCSLSEEELTLLDQRMSGQTWEELATEWNTKPDAIRKRLTRAIDRVANEIGIIDL